MKRRLVVLLAILSLVGVAAVPAVGKGHNTNFRAHLNGASEVPEADTNAQGQAIFKLSKDGNELHFKVIVANIDDVVMAHIHNAPEGENGGIVAWLFPASPPPPAGPLFPGRTQGVVAEGSITADDLTGALAGGDLADLIALIQSDEAYVNVHTSEFPGGEIRGQIH